MNCTTCGQPYRILTNDDGTARSTCKCDFGKPCDRGLKRCGVLAVVLVDPYDLSFVLTHWCEKHVPDEWASLLAPAAKPEKPKPVKPSQSRGCAMAGCGNVPKKRICYDETIHSDWCDTCFPFMASVLTDAKYPHEVRHLR